MTDYVFAITHAEFLFWLVHILGIAMLFVVGVVLGGVWATPSRRSGDDAVAEVLAEMKDVAKGWNPKDRVPYRWIQNWVAKLEAIDREEVD